MNWPSLSLLGQSILSGIFIGALYGLFGLGLSLSWGLLRLINLAHFALAFLGAYLAYQLSSSGAMDPLLTLLVIVPGFFLFGMAMHWVFMRFAVSPFNSLLVTFGITVIIESCIQWCRHAKECVGEEMFRKLMERKNTLGQKQEK